MFRVKSKPFFYRIQKYIMLVAWLSFVSGCSKPYSDSQLIELLSENKAQFEELVILSKQCIRDESTIFWIREADDKISPCGDIMKVIDIRGIAQNSNGAIVFYIHDGNYRSAQKGLIYSEDEMEPIFESLDINSSEVQPYKNIYKKLNDNWYIYFVSV